MRRTNRVVAIAGAAVLLAGLTPAAEAEPVAPSTAKRKVCKGIKGCYVMGHVDVTGDGKRDWVGAVNRNGRKIRKGKVTVRVLTRGRIEKRKLKVRNWRGDVFHGIARIDGRRGAELVVGANRNRFEQRTSGGTKVTHSKAFHVVTYRHGKLVRSKAPGRKSRAWWLTSRRGVRSGDTSIPDGATSKKVGLYRKARKGTVRLVRKEGGCTGVAGCYAERVAYVWRGGHWKKKGKRSGNLNADGGWHVKGLPVW